MKRRSNLGFIVLAILLAVAEMAGLEWQWQETLLLRADLAQARLEAAEFERLREENNRLRAQQISTAELKRLRADHAALPRLQAEIETLKDR